MMEEPASKNMNQNEATVTKPIRIPTCLVQEVTYEKQQKENLRGIIWNILEMAQRVYDYFGFGFREAVYQSALELEISKAGLFFKHEPMYTIHYLEMPAAHLRPDILIMTPDNHRIVLELKTVSSIDKKCLDQLSCYKKVTDCDICILINFGPDGLRVADSWGKVYLNVNAILDKLVQQDEDSEYV